MKTGLTSRVIGWRETTWVLVGVWCLIGLACTTIEPGAPRDKVAAFPGAVLVGSGSCSECHDETVTAFAATIHGRMHGAEGGSCESCHGPASEHLATGGDAIMKPNDASCLACHSETHGSAKFVGAKSMGEGSHSAHASAGVGCTDCHESHGTSNKLVRANASFRPQNMDAVSSMCSSCHQDVFARTAMPNRHPIREGAMSCTSCHDPHAISSRQTFAQNDSCVKCHQAQQGPFSHEHQPVVESCTTCHEPHGSPIAKMAKLAQPMLCLQCHSLTINRHTNVLGQLSPASLRDCTSCHGAIHGSDMEAYLRH